LGATSVSLVVVRGTFVGGMRPGSWRLYPIPPDSCNSLGRMLVAQKLPYRDKDLSVKADPGQGF